MKSCPRCNLPIGGTDECQHCGYVIDRPTLKKSKKNIYIIFLVLLILLGTGGYTAFNNIVSPYLNKLAEDKKKQEFIKAGKEDIKNCKNAYLAFKKIEALLESGVNYNDYSKVLGNAKYELNILKVNSKRSDLLKIIYDYYNRANEIWSARLDNDYERMCNLIHHSWSKGYFHLVKLMSNSMNSNCF